MGLLARQGCPQVVPKGSDAAKLLAKRTLTDLYDAGPNPGRFLRQCSSDIRAKAVPYGWW
jgi:hypothetical protein